MALGALADPNLVLIFKYVVISYTSLHKEQILRQSAHLQKYV